MASATTIAREARVDQDQRMRRSHDGSGTEYVVRSTEVDQGPEGLSGQDRPGFQLPNRIRSRASGRQAQGRNHEHGIRLTRSRRRSTMLSASSRMQ